MRKSATVLIIDDSPEDRHAYISFLQQHDDCIYTFLEADDAEDGLRIFNQAHIDLVLLDYQLPDLNGLDFLERLRDHQGSVGVPVVMMTGRGSEEVAVQALKAGVADYLVKAAVNPTSLYRATHNALERGRLTAQLARETADREQAEAELRESEARFRLLVESVHDHAIVMLDREGRIDSWNAGARAMFGYHDREIIGQHFRRLFTPEDVRAHVPERELREATLQRRASDERWHVHRNGTRLWTAGSISAVFDPTGVHRGYAKVLRDVTERRQTSEQLQEALEVRDEFLAVASHELKTPVTTLMLKVQHLLRRIERSFDGVPTSQVQAGLRDANAQIEQLQSVLENLLDVSRMSARQKPVSLQPVELGSLVESVVVDRSSSDRAVISVERREEVHGVWDRARLEQVVRHVLGSATRQALGSRVAVRVERSGNIGRVTFGLDGVAHELPPAPTDRSAPELAGLGLGLYVSRHILQALGGTIRVQGQPGRDALYTIELTMGEHGDIAGRSAGV